MKFDGTQSIIEDMKYAWKHLFSILYTQNLSPYWEGIFVMLNVFLLKRLVKAIHTL